MAGRKGMKHYPENFKVQKDAGKKRLLHPADKSII